MDQSDAVIEPLPTLRGYESTARIFRSLELPLRWMRDDEVRSIKSSSPRPTSAPRLPPFDLNRSSWRR